MANPFTAHPATVGESYFQHMGVAIRFGGRMVLAGLGALVHGVFPFLCKTTGSSTVAALHEEIVAKRSQEAQQRSVEFVI